ncbi:MAG: DUF3788 domain-containing protein [Oscillospiraceae bacterium]|jgi:hypothetical protein|nr:DUF3788 domain-containing protein [Oscillospiraceae bacterium]
MAAPEWKRLSDPNREPAPKEIGAFIGPDGIRRLDRLESLIGALYITGKELRCPFGRKYGWGYKFSSKSAHLCYAFFEAGTITVTTQLSGAAVDKLEAILPTMLPRTQEYWKNRYPCGKNGGGWVHYRVENDNEIADIIELLKFKKPPKNA